MSEPAPHLRVVDEAGQLHDECPGCEEREITIEGLQSTIRSQAATMRKLRRDKDAEAAQHDLFPAVKRLFDEWREATGHTGSEFNAARFDMAVPYLRNPKYGEHYIRQAIRGIAFQPHKADKANRNGKVEVYDQWKHLFKDVEALERYHGRAPVDHLAELLLDPASLPAHERNLAAYMPDGATPWDGPLPADWDTA